jgi:hypothetical protein
VLKMQEQLKAAGMVHQDAALHKASRQAVYNTPPFTATGPALASQGAATLGDFEGYLDGFFPPMARSS